MSSFQNSAKLNAHPFDAYALSKLSLWQELITQMRLTKLLDTYSDKATEYQVLSLQKPDLANISLYSAAYAYLGDKLVAENDLEQALIWLRKAIALEPNNCWYHDRLGAALTKVYDLDSAVASFRQAIRLKPTYQPYRAKLNTALRLQKSWRELTDYCQQRIDTPRNGDKLNMLMIFPYPPYPPL